MNPTRCAGAISSSHCCSGSSQTLERHHGIARVPLANVPTGPNAAIVADRVIGLLRAGGVDDRSIGFFIDCVFLYINATAYETAIYVEEGVPQDGFDETIRAAFAATRPRDDPEHDVDARRARQAAPATSASGSGCG